ncbi:AMP-binding protein [Vibrio penaeicida]|uniref:AMP-binding protein n=1 Tax=Vibrio penaeicida TaxID=104609 RepID=UPI000CE9F9B4|nr:AMP-binding protein [Vibrio penaeicida]
MRKHIFQAMLESADEPALWVANQYYSYRELVEKAHLISESCCHYTSEKVAVLAHRSLFAYASVIGCYFSGLTWIPMNNKKSPAQLTEIMLDTETQVIACDVGHQKILREMLDCTSTRWTIIFEKDVDVEKWQNDFPDHQFILVDDTKESETSLSEISENKLAYIMHTSGSTGKPKRIPISYQNLSSYLENIQNAFPLSKSDRVAQFSDLSFDLSVHDMFSAWMHGACLYCIPEILKTNPIQFIRHYQLTAWLSVPSVIDLSLQRDELAPDSLPSLKLSIFCGQALATDLADKWQKATGQKVVNIYGPTECSVTVTAHTYQPEVDRHRTSVPVGLPFRKNTLAIIDSDNQPQLIDQFSGELKGELYIKGVQLAGKYWNDEENTQRAYFHDNESTLWYKTGDLAEWREGVLHHLGRNDHQVKIAGHRVELGEIETVARKISRLSTVAAVPWPLSRAGYANGVVVFFQSDGELDEPEIIKQFSNYLPRAISPKQIFALKNMPRNINGKTDINALYEQLEGLSACK